MSDEGKNSALLLGKKPVHNLLVVSDLHLGETLVPSGLGFLRQIAKLNQAFCQFVGYYAAHPIEGAPWRLVVAGDMMDFVRASLHAEVEAEARALAGGAALDVGTAEAAVRALELIFDHHPKVFGALAEFIGKGNELVVIKGNHDAEFHWEEVQRRFSELLALRYVAQNPPGSTGDTGGLEADASVAAQEAFRTRVRFYRWFYYERDLVYIEHGNQYDEFCSFEHVLSPLVEEKNRPALEDPISHQTFRAFAKMILGTLDIHTIDHMKLFDFVRWLVRLGPRLLARLAYTYFGSIGFMIRARRKLALAAQKASGAHLAALKQLAQHFPLAEGVLHELDDLRHRPAAKSVFSGIQMLYMDRIFVMLGTVATLLGVLVFLEGETVLRAGVAGGVGLSSLLVLAVLAPLRKVYAPPKLRRVAQKIGALLRVRFVVFGHTHVAHKEPLASSLENAEEGFYFNTGSWTAGKNGLTHLCILAHETIPRAELRRWDPTQQLPLLLETA